MRDSDRGKTVIIEGAYQIRQGLGVQLQLEVAVVAVLKAGVLPEQGDAEYAEQHVIQIAQIRHIRLIAMRLCEARKRADHIVIAKIVLQLRKIARDMLILQ